jgi:hypothetical protein
MVLPETTTITTTACPSLPSLLIGLHTTWLPPVTLWLLLHVPLPLHSHWRHHHARATLCHHERGVAHGQRDATLLLLLHLLGKEVLLLVLLLKMHCHGLLLQLQWCQWHGPIECVNHLYTHIVDVGHAKWVVGNTATILRGRLLLRPAVGWLHLKLLPLCRHGLPASSHGIAVPLPLSWPCDHDARGWELHATRELLRPTPVLSRHEVAAILREPLHHVVVPSQPLPLHGHWHLEHWGRCSSSQAEIGHVLRRCSIELS